MLPAYALEALGPDENAYVEGHLESCPRCLALAQEYAQVSEAMLHMPPAIKAPAGLRRKMQRLVQAERPPLMRRLGAIFQRQPGLGVVAAAAIIGLLIVNLLLLQQVGSLVAQQKSLQQQVDRNQTAMAVLSYPSAEVADVQGETVFGTLVYDPERRVAVLYAWGLEPLTSGKVYQAWLRNEAGARISAGIFEAEADGQFSVVLLRSPEPIAGFVGLGVTIEPSGGSDEPTTEPLLNVDL